MSNDAIKVIPQSRSLLTRQDELEQKVLPLLAAEGVAEIRRLCGSGIFKHSTGKLSSSIKGEVTGSNE